MARIRSIKPEFWEDEAIALLSRDARLLYIGTWNLADDEGLLRWTPEYIKAQLFMYDEDITSDVALALMAELVDGGLVFPYRGGKLQQKLGWIVNFHKHQKPNRPQPSKLPAPSIQNPQVKRAYAERDGWLCHICGDEIETNPDDRPARLASLDHLIPRSKSGSDYPSNIRVAHFGCNSSKGTKPLEPEDVNDSLNDSLNDSYGDWQPGDESLTSGGEGRGGVEEGSPPGGNVPFVRRLADELRQEHGCEFVEQATLYLAFQKLLQAALEHLPEQRHHATAMGVIAAFVERGQGLAMTRESRAHTARLVRTHPPLAVLNGFGQALHWGAGVDAKYATDPLSLSKYVAGVLATDRKGAA